MVASQQQLKPPAPEETLPCYRGKLRGAGVAWVLLAAEEEGDDQDLDLVVVELWVGRVVREDRRQRRRRLLARARMTLGLCSPRSSCGRLMEFTEQYCSS